MALQCGLVLMVSVCCGPTVLLIEQPTPVDGNIAHSTTQVPHNTSLKLQTMVQIEELLRSPTGRVRTLP